MLQQSSVLQVEIIIWLRSGTFPKLNFWYTHWRLDFGKCDLVVITKALLRIVRNNVELLGSDLSTPTDESVA